MVVRETANYMDASPVPPQGTAILCLFDVSGQSMDWYWKEIAGVPFILRNILNIQRGGIDHLAVYSNKLNDFNKTRLTVIDNDPRVRLKLEWISEPKELVKSAKDEGTLIILDGSALHSKADVENALDIVDGVRSKKSFIFPLQNNTLKTLLENIDTFSLAGFEKILQEDFKSGFMGQKRNLIFMPGTNETLIASEADFTVQREILLGACGLNNDSLMERLVTRPLSNRLTPILLMTSLTPNLITAISFILGLGSAFFFYQGNYLSGIMGAILLQVAAWTNCIDGEVTRIKLMESKTGDRLNMACSYIVLFAVFFAIGMGTYATSGNILYKQLGTVAVMGSFVSFLITLSATLKNKSRDACPKSSYIEKITRQNFTYFLLFMALIHQLGMFVMAAALGTNTFVLLLLYEKAKPSLIPVNNDFRK